MKRNYFTACFLSHFCVGGRVAAALVFAVCLLGVTIARADTVFTAALNGNQAVPATNSTATGVGSVILNDAENEVTVTLKLNGLQNAQTNARVHGPALRGSTADMIFSLPTGVSTQKFSVTTSEAANLKAGLWYFNVITTNFPNGEIRGQIEPLCAPPPLNMAAWYRAENNANDWVSGNNGIVPNGVSYPSGKVGQAFGFNGANQYANLGNFFDYKTFSISMWVKPGETQLAFANLVDNNRSSAANWAIEQNSTAANHYYYVDNGGSVPFDLEPNVWQHLTVVRGENIILIYRDGVVLNSSLTSGLVNYDGAQTLLLARYFNRSNQGSNRNWNGQIDEFTVFNRALSEADVRNLYFSGNTGVCTQSAFMRAQNGKIVFSRQTETNSTQIFSINSDGSNLTNLSNSSSGDQYPSFSPDGAGIVFARNSFLYTMNADGTNQRKLTGFTSLPEAYPAWSPDGNRIAFTYGGSANAEIYTVNSNGTNPTRLTNNTNLDTGASWSRDGTKIVFSRSVSPNQAPEIYTMNPDGSDLKFLTNGSDSSWSPDGSKILHNRATEIYVMNPDGTGSVNLTKTSGIYEYGAEWSPDGTKIVYTRVQNGGQEIWIMNADGSGQMCLVCGGGVNTNPSWQPILNNQNVIAYPASNIKVNFSYVETRGRMVATPLLSKQLPDLPVDFLSASPIYDIRTSAVYHDFVTVSFVVKSVVNASDCEQLRILHFTNGAWSNAGNDTPVFASGTCTVSQTVSTLSPFTIARRNISPTTTLSGTIFYGTTPTGSVAKLVSNVSLTATGTTYDSIDTNSNGAYTFERLVMGGAYNVSLSKTGNENGISPFDATLILRHIAAGTNGILTPNQRLAADTNNSGTISPFDATLILRYVAAGGATKETGAVGNWKFTPATGSYSSLPGSLSDQNYEAILVGEVNGNWSPPQPNSFANADVRTVAAEAENLSFVEEMGAINRKSAAIGAQLLLDTKASRIGKGSLIIPVLLTNNSKSISGFSTDVIFDSNILELDSIQPIETTDTLTANSFSVVSDTTKPGRIGIAASGGADLITGNGTLIKLRFKVKDTAKMALNQKTLTLSRTLLENN